MQTSKGELQKGGDTQKGVTPYTPQQEAQMTEKERAEFIRKNPGMTKDMLKLLESQKQSEQAVIEAPTKSLIERAGVELPDYVTINQKKFREDAALERGRELKKKVEETNRQINFFKTKQEEYETEMMMIARGLGLEQSFQPSLTVKPKKWVIGLFVLAVLNITLSSVLVNYTSPIKNPSDESSVSLVNCNNASGNVISCGNENFKDLPLKVGLNVFVQSGSGDSPIGTVITSINKNNKTFTTNNTITGLSNSVLLADNTWIKNTSNYSIGLLIIGLSQLVTGIWIVYRGKNESVSKAWILLFSILSVALVSLIPSFALPYNLKIAYGFQIAINGVGILVVMYEIFTGIKEIWPLLFG
jgi:hypothetical protein